MFLGGVRGAISSATHCASCSGNINPGDIAVFSERIGDKQCWHPQCFKCCVDDTFLVDLIHGVRNNKLYCMRHWSEQIKPRCHGCEEVCVFYGYSIFDVFGLFLSIFIILCISLNMSKNKLILLNIYVLPN